MKRLTLLLSILFIFCCQTLMAEEFIAKHGSFEINGEKTKITDLSKFPVFNAEYQPSSDMVTINSSAGKLILRKGVYFYSYRGVHNGLTVTVTANVENGKITHIAYEEYDKSHNMKAVANYYKR